MRGRVNRMADISIIIPVYNAEKYLNRCLNSIEFQTYKDYEVIMVDDGSTDSSLQICRDYSQKDNRFRLFHQENQGASAARNTALEKARGKYLCFVDADDCYSTDEALQILFEKMEESDADVCIFSWNIYEADGKIRTNTFSKDEMAGDPETLIKILMNGNYQGGGGNPWNKIWRADSLIKNGVIHEFDADLQIYEDMLWVVQGLEKAKKIVFLNQPLYCYYILEGSISRRGDPLKKGIKYVEGAKRVYEYISLNCYYAKDKASVWYGDKYSSYLMKKVRGKVRFSAEERRTIREFSLRPTKNIGFRMWRRVCFLKLISLFK